MRFITRTFLFMMLGFANVSAFSAESLAESTQILVVMTPSWEASQGKLQLYQRANTRAPWRAKGEAIPVVVGKNGLGWGLDPKTSQFPGPFKQEGDGRSPVGIFGLGPLFGFEEQPSPSFKLAYLPLKETTVCVDDEKSNYYNQLVDSSTLEKPDWSSGELMRQVPLYYWGAVIQYNPKPAKPHAGSCIFLHTWRASDKGTAGCVAMEQSHLVAVLNALDSTKKPLLVLLSKPAYELVKKRWSLPQALEAVLR
jgi:D-alanyl-D-alanine dipeptidase